MTTKDSLLRYGISSGLAQKATDAGLSISKIRALSTKEILKQYNITILELKELKKCVTRNAIPQSIANDLLEKSNHTCCVCKGIKGQSVIIHHIIPYETSQDNSYQNLAVLCPSDHDRAHRPSGLSLSLSAEEVRRLKGEWEDAINTHNITVASGITELDSGSIDYINIPRIEELCIRLFGRMPPTYLSDRLRKNKILDENFYFNETYVRKNKSNGGYLFDYIYHGETEHYRQILETLSEKIKFRDLNAAACSGIRKLSALEGQYAIFTGAVTSKRPKMPVTQSTPPFAFNYKSNGVLITWDANANYLMSSSAIGRQGRRQRYTIYCRVGSVTKKLTPS